MPKVAPDADPGARRSQTQSSQRHDASFIHALTAAPELTPRKMARVFELCRRFGRAGVACGTKSEFEFELRIQRCEGSAAGRSRVEFELEHRSRPREGGARRGRQVEFEFEHRCRSREGGARRGHRTQSSNSNSIVRRAGDGLSRTRQVEFEFELHCLSREGGARRGRPSRVRIRTPFSAARGRPVARAKVEFEFEHRSRPREGARSAAERSPNRAGARGTHG